jgi:hypothetical protein
MLKNVNHSLPRCASGKDASNGRSSLLVADVLILGGVEEQVADGSNQGVNTKGYVGKQEVCPRSGGEAFGLEGRVVDDDTTDKAEEKRQQKANNVLVIHSDSPYKYNIDAMNQSRSRTPKKQLSIVVVFILS